MTSEIREIPFEKRLYGRSKPVLENQKPVDAMFADPIDHRDPHRPEITIAYEIN